MNIKNTKNTIIDTNLISKIYNKYEIFHTKYKYSHSKYIQLKTETISESNKYMLKHQKKRKLEDGSSFNNEDQIMLCHLNKKKI
jgi:hypothetical protein